MENITTASTSISPSKDISKDRKWTIQLIFLLSSISIGWILGYTTELAAPIHEVGHWIIGGPQARIVSWARTEGLEIDPIQIVQGFLFQVYVLLACSFVIGAIGNHLRGWYGLGGFPYGLAIGSFFYAFESGDFNTLPYELLAGSGTNIPQYMAGVRSKWTLIIGGILIAYGIYVLYFRIIRSHKKPAR